MFWIKLLSKFIKTLHSETNPTQIALGFALGAVVGLSPLFSPQSVLIFSLILIVNVNIGAALLSITIFKSVAWLWDGPAHTIGSYLLLNATSLRGMWTSLYNTPVVPFTRFYNTVVLGNLILALIAFIPITLLSRMGVVYYRTHLMGKMEQYKIVKIVKGTKFYKWYQRLRHFRGAW